MILTLQLLSILVLSEGTHWYRALHSDCFATELESQVDDICDASFY
jgi:hypothetical protein